MYPYQHPITLLITSLKQTRGGDSMSLQIDKSSKEKGIDQQSGRYSGIISAIEFFSQRFEIEQLISYAFDFSHDLLLPDQIVLWSLKDGVYHIGQSKGYDESFSFQYLEQYDQIVYFHAGLLYDKNIATLLPPEIRELFKPDFCIPLIMDKSFFGLIALKRSSDNLFTPEDEIFAGALMNLFSTALTNYSSYKHLEKTKIQLDEKIFNLFAMNQSTKALLSELSLDNLYDLAISVFSELTQSSFTTFFIKDPISENYQLMSYKNVHAHNLNLEMTLYENKEQVNGMPVLIDMAKKKNRDLFISTFINGQEIIDKINPFYVVLLKKSTQLVGFVTLGSKVNDTHYDNSIFELVESLASATYIAINNAFFIQEINEQKKMVHTKLNEMIKLNLLMKNINSAQTYEKVITLVMNTLNVSFGLDMGFFALYNSDKNTFALSNKFNMKNKIHEIEMPPEWMPLLNGESIITYEEDKVEKYIPRQIIITFMKNASGVVIIPIYIKQLSIHLIGFFAMFSNRSKTLVTEENLVSFDAIATHIAPVIHQLLYAEGIMNTYEPDHGYFFLKQLKKEVEEAIDFGLDLYVIHIYHKNPVHFKTITIAKPLKEHFKNCYPTDKRNIFILTNKTTDLLTVEEYMTESHLKKVYQLGSDFEDYAAFLKIFEA